MLVHEAWKSTASVLSLFCYEKGHTHTKGITFFPNWAVLTFSFAWFMKKETWNNTKHKRKSLTGTTKQNFFNLEPSSHRLLRWLWMKQPRCACCIGQGELHLYSGDRTTQEKWLGCFPTRLVFFERWPKQSSNSWCEKALKWMDNSVMAWQEAVHQFDMVWILMIWEWPSHPPRPSRGQRVK